mgnify:CR=1 FL=1
MIVKKLLWALVIVAAFGALFLPGYTRIQELRDRNRELEVKIKRLKIENALFEIETKRLKNDPLYREQIMREKLGVVRKGEIPVKIVTESADLKN